MSYTSPSGNSVDFNAKSSYTTPTASNLDFSAASQTTNKTIVPLGADNNLNNFVLDVMATIDKTV